MYRHNKNDTMTYIREDMVRNLAARGVASSTVLEAVMRTPRHLFVSEALRYRAYHDTSLPIGFGQTISKPSVIARMVQGLALTGRERVLEIGTGSGYQTAILAQLCASVVTLERIRELSMRARSAVVSFGFTNINFLATDNFNDAAGLFDAVVVAAGADILPARLLEKVNPGGILIIPVGAEGDHQIMKYIKRHDGSCIEERIGEATFVPLIIGNRAV